MLGLRRQFETPTMATTRRSPRRRVGDVCFVSLEATAKDIWCVNVTLPTSQRECLSYRPMERLLVSPDTFPSEWIGTVEDAVATLAEELERDIAGRPVAELVPGKK